MYLLEEFLFFLKNLVTEPQYVSMWIILNDLKFGIDVSWNSVIALIRLRPHLDSEKKLSSVLSLELFVLCIWFGIPVTTMFCDGSSLHSMATVLFFSFMCFINNGDFFFNFWFYLFPLLICSFVLKCYFRFLFPWQAPFNNPLLITLFVNSHFTEYLVLL